MGSASNWTDAEIAELRRLMNYQLTYAEIGEKMGRSPGGIRIKVSRLGWGSVERAGHLQSLRTKGKKRPDEVLQKIVEATRRRCQDPVYRQKLADQVSRNAHNPKRLEAVRKTMDRKRGGPMTPEIAKTVKFLREVKKYRVREAYALAIAEARKTAVVPA